MASHNLVYAGIGSRKTPPLVLQQMRQIAEQLSPVGWQLRSGHADGADKAFERDAVHKEIHLPWDGYNNCRQDNITYFVPDPRVPGLLDIAARNHPAWDRLGLPVKNMMVRNTTILLGLDLASPVKFICCWTESGKVEGGTGHALRVARDPLVMEIIGEIPIFNLANPDDVTAFVKFVTSYGE